MILKNSNALQKLSSEKENLHSHRAHSVVSVNGMESSSREYEIDIPSGALQPIDTTAGNIISSGDRNRRCISGHRLRMPLLQCHDGGAERSGAALPWWTKAKHNTKKKALTPKTKPKTARSAEGKGKGKGEQEDERKGEGKGKG